VTPSEAKTLKYWDEAACPHRPRHRPHLLRPRRSGIAWRMIGSSSDAIMTTEEWYVGVFDPERLCGKACIWHFGRSALNRSSRCGATRSGNARDAEAERCSHKPDARSLVVKLMDYHIVFAQMIAASFERGTIVNLTRHPYGLCGSLMRSGLSLEDACRWYEDVARLMATHADSGAITVCFEDVVSHPMETCDGLYPSLGVRWAEDGKFEFKLKPYGAERMADVGSSASAHRMFPGRSTRLFYAGRRNGCLRPNGVPFGISRAAPPRGSVIRRPVASPRWRERAVGSATQEIRQHLGEVARSHLLGRHPGKRVRRRSPRDRAPSVV
jgi:hypothetical protein